MPKNVQCRRCANYWHEWCGPKRDSPDPDVVRDCDYFWTRTNGEKIRQSDDAELANFIGFVVQDAYLMGRGEREHMKIFPFESHDEILAWLKSNADVEEENDGRNAT